MTPVAVFEIVGSGSKIPSCLKQQGSDRLILKGPWIGVAIFAAIAVQRIDAYMKAQYVVTAHIHLGEQHWRIVVPIDVALSGFESQLVIYWTVVDDLQRNLDSSREKEFGVSFSVDPAGGQ